MFFETNKVSDVLLCQNCEGRLDMPKILSCGETICSLCETSIQIKDRMFDCLVCKEKHKMPKNGLINDKIAMKMLSIEATKVSRGTAYNLLLKLLDEIHKKRNLIKLGIENSSDLITEYCMNLRNEVQLTAEEAISQINDIISKIIEEIDEFEKKLIEFIKTNSKTLENKFNEIANKSWNYLRH